MPPLPGRVTGFSLMAKTKVLLADASSTIQTIVSMALEDKPVELHFANSGQEALQKVIDIRPDVLLVDMQLPDMDGIDVCTKIRTQPEFAPVSDVPIVIMLGIYETLQPGAQEATEERALSAGADDTLIKPFDPNELYEKIENAMRKQTGEKAGGGIETVKAPLEDVLMKQEESTLEELEKAIEEEKDKEESEAESTVLLTAEEREKLMKELIGGETQTEEPSQVSTSAVPEILPDELMMGESEEEETAEESGEDAGQGLDTVLMPSPSFGGPSETVEEEPEESIAKGLETVAQEPFALEPPPVEEPAGEEQTEESITDVSTEPTQPVEHEIAPPEPELEAPAFDLTPSEEPAGPPPESQEVSPFEEAPFEEPLQTKEPTPFADEEPFGSDLFAEEPVTPEVPAEVEEEDPFGIWASEEPAQETHPAEEEEAADRVEAMEVPVEPPQEDVFGEGGPQEPEVAPAEVEEQLFREQEPVVHEEQPVVEEPPEPDVVREHIHDKTIELEESELAEEIEEETPPAPSQPVNTEEIVQYLLTHEEFIERLAQKIVQYLSGKILEDIAWQVVPDLAEQLVKQTLEEQKNED